MTAKLMCSKIMPLVIWGFRWDEMNRVEARERHYFRGTCMTAIPVEIVI